jgi:hypothetical protein
VYATNGGRPVRIRGRAAKFAGALPPTTRPTVTVQKYPLWAANVSGSANAENDPGLKNTTAGVQSSKHFSTFGNNWLKQVYNDEIRWEQVANGANYDVDIWAFKCLVRLRSTAGRIPIRSARNSVDSGGMFLEVRDGHLWLGWYDRVLKAEQTVHTNIPVIEPGYWYYLYARKKYPRQNGVGDSDGDGVNDVTTSNWYNQVTALTPNNVNDVLVWRRFPKTASESTRPWDAKVDGVSRNYVSATTADHGLSGATATGLVTHNGKTFNITGAPSAVIVTSDASAIFSADMVGMYWQWTNVAGDTTLYRVTAVSNTGGAPFNADPNKLFTTITVVNAQSGASPSFAGATYNGKKGGVYLGANLIKSTNFDASKDPDGDLSYDVELFGSILATQENTNITPFDGDWDSHAEVVRSYNTAGTADEGTDLFADAPAAGTTWDEAFNGSDIFSGTVYGTTAPGPLRAESGFTYVAVHCYQGATNNTEITANAKPAATAWLTTQPNEKLEIAKDAAPSSVNAPNFYWQYAQGVQLFDGKRQLAVAFYDADQDIVSNPSPRVFFTPPVEDKGNPSGAARLVVKNLPVPRDDGNVQRYIYVSAADGFELFRALIVPDGESSEVSLYQSDFQLANKPVIEYFNDPPPRCGTLAASQGYMFYGDLFDQPDRIMFSRPNKPGIVPLPQYLVLRSGATARCVALADLRGRLIAYKGGAMFKVTMQEAVPYTEIVTAGAGVVSPTAIVSLDDRHYFISNRGFHAYTGTGDPVFLGTPVHDTFSGMAANVVADKLYLGDACLAINRARDQCVLAFRATGQNYMRDRITTEFDHELSGVTVGNRLPAGHRFSRYRGPAFTALGSVLERGTGTAILVGGTVDGFLVFMDRSDTALELMGATAAAWGAQTATLTSGGTTGKLPISAGAVDTILAGQRGTAVRWLEGTTEREAFVLFATTSAIYLDRQITVAVPTSGTATLGAQVPYWETRWFDFGAPEQRKHARYLDIVLAPQSAGTAVVQVFTDFGTTNRLLTPNGSAWTLDLTAGFQRVNLNAIQARFFKARVSLVTPTVNQRFELAEMVFRFTGEDQVA